MNVVRLVVAGITILLMPGFLLLAFLGDDCRDVAECLALSIGLSISLMALAALILFWLQLSVLAVSLWAFYVLTFLYLVRRAAGSVGYLIHRSKEIVVVAACAAVVISWRLYQTHALVFPPWVDSISHVLIVEKIIENGALPGDLTPYLPVPFYYHFAFHVVTAAFSVLGGIGAPSAVLTMGQVLNGLIAFSVYYLGRSLGYDLYQSASAAALVTFVFKMPGYYATWGRYTLVTGFVMLPLAMAELEKVYSGEHFFKHLSLFLVLGIGVMLSHYYTALLLCVWIMIVAATRWKRTLPLLRLTGVHRSTGSWVFLVVVFSLSLFSLLWLCRLWGFVGKTITDSFMGRSISYKNGTLYLWKIMGPERDFILFPVAAGGLVLAAYRRKRLRFVLWSVYVAGSCVPFFLHIPPFDAFYYIISLFLPASLFTIEFLWFFADKVRNLLGNTVSPAPYWVLVPVLPLVLWGVRDNAHIIKPQTILATKNDLAATQWISDHTAATDRFFINVAPWGYDYRPVDGGGWVQVLTGRQTVLPPTFYVRGSPAYVRRINAVGRMVASLSACDETFWKIVRTYNLDYLYLTRGRGALRPQEVASCTEARLEFEQGDVRIYHLERPPKTFRMFHPLVQISER